MGKQRSVAEEFPGEEIVGHEVVDDGTDKKYTRRGRKSRRNPVSKSKFPLWGGELNWRDVTPAAESFSLLVGSEEGGFLSLEEFDGESWQTPRSEIECEKNSPEVAHDLERIDSAQLSSRSKRQKKSQPGEKQIDTIHVLPLGDDSVEGNCFHQEATGERVVAQRETREKKKKIGRQGKENSARSPCFIHPTAEDLNFSQVPSQPEGDHKKSVTQEGHPKKKKSKLGSRARKLVRGKRLGVGGQDAESAEEERDIEPAEITSEVLDGEVMDMSAWAEMRLHPLLEKAIGELKFREPTPIQRECIPAAAHKGKDVIGAAETGSGKTLAFVLPILQRLLEEKDKASNQTFLKDGKENVEESKRERHRPLRALIISPTRELAMQICEHLKAVSKWTTIRVVPIVGGMAKQKQQRFLRQGPEIVVGTPGRLWELMSDGENHLLELQWLSFFVLDEADRMVEKGHFKELQSIIDMLSSTQSLNSEKDAGNAELINEGVGNAVDLLKSKKRRQTLVFSATLALPADFKSKLKKGHQMPKSGFRSVDSVAALSERAGVSHKAAIVDLTSSMIVAKELLESIVECREEDKDQYLYYILKVHGGGRTIVFCTSIAALRRVSAILRLLQIPAWPLHAQMQQKARLKAMDRFRENEDCVLVATDVAARGLDVPGIRTVVHYQLPHSAEIYVHRCGRTARASSDGISIAFVSPADSAKYLILCRALSRPEGLQPFPVNRTYLPAIEKRVSLAVKVDKLMRKQSQLRATHSWLALNAKAMDVQMEVSEDEGELSRASKNSKSLSKGDLSKLQLLQKELQEMLSQLVKPKAFSNHFITGAGMTPLVIKQLQDHMLANSVSRGAGPAIKKKGKLVIIGQEQIEPLEALRLSANIPCAKRKRY